MEDEPRSTAYRAKCSCRAETSLLANSAAAAAAAAGARQHKPGQTSGAWPLQAQQPAGSQTSGAWPLQTQQQVNGRITGAWPFQAHQQIRAKSWLHCPGKHNSRPVVTRVDAVSVS
eukprot:353497-Chlamydomonas_euryale.AAC.3